MIKSIVQRFAAMICLLYVSHSVFAKDLQSTTYEVLIGQFNSDGFSDILLRPKDLFVLIMLDDLSFPVFAKSTFDTTVISSFSNGLYAIDSSAQKGAIDQTQWLAGNFDVIEGDFNDDGNNELLLVPLTPNRASFILASTPGATKPSITQQLNPGDFGLDFGAANTKVSLEDRNNDGRTDIVVNRDGMLLAVLLANNDGIFSPVGDKKEDLVATISAIWSGFGTRLDNGEMSKAVEYFSITSKENYQRIFTVLGNDIKNLTSFWSKAVPLIVEKDYAEYAVTQTANGKTRLHIIGFSRDSNGQWGIEQL